MTVFARRAARAEWRQGFRARSGLLLLFALGVAVIWLPHRPPMVDLPQYAGQIALLRDLARGRSPWASEVQINLFTPYLLGYGLTFPLAMVMSAAAAIKVVLTLSYAAFAAVCIGIRRELSASPKLDAYYFISFFGYAYGFGFYTFLVSAPAGLGFIWLAIRYARLGGAARGLWLAVFGVALVFSHGLIFLFSCAIGLGVLLANMRAPKSVITRSWPYAPPLLLCAAFFFVMRTPKIGVASHFARIFDMGSISARLSSFIWNSFDFHQSAIWSIALVILGALPFCAGLKLDMSRTDRIVPAVCVVIVMALVPSYAWSTAWLFQRFALFLLPAYAWLFIPAEAPQSSVARFVGPSADLVAVGIACLVLVAHIEQALRFSREAQDFDAVESYAVPGQRALSVVLDSAQGSATEANPFEYLHFPLWYQAEKHGFVDFNFAYFRGELAKLRDVDQPPYNDQRFVRYYYEFDWRRDEAWRYRYFFVRHTRPLPATLFAGADCAPVKVAARGAWELFERRPCPEPAS